MAPLASPRFKAASLRSRQGGFALILVLGCVVLLTVLVTGLLSSSSTELHSSRQYESEASTRLLADSCVNMVISQIRDATAGGSTVAWASQPGMIRTYDNTGNFLAAYKLYSSDEMVPSQFNAATESANLANWSANTALYTDLNAPVNNHYPIFDPTTANPTPLVVGSGLSGAPVATSNNGATPNPAPMPVKWIYVLQDGSFATAVDAGNNSVTVTPVNQNDKISTSNPIIGRIAFWTDDETCKININTAGGDAWPQTGDSNNLGINTNNVSGAFWDTPRVVSLRDGAPIASAPTQQSFALCQPANGEYQRYPGHPATTYLSAVFPNLTETNLLSLLPRINGGGSNSGTAVPTGPLAAKDARLYASVDELYFSPVLSGSTRQANSAMSAGTISPILLDQSRFFLTAYNRAPEVNLFNLPRIAMWPINSSSTARTTLDNLMAFCTTIAATYPYYFQRADSTSPTNDWNQISRNQTLFTYLQNLTSTAIPGFGGTFSGKYGTKNCNQILTEIFDYIRCCNLYDITAGAIPYAPGTGSSVPTGMTTLPGVGQVAPIYMSQYGTQGFGRFPTVTEAGFVFAGVGQGAITTTTPTTPAVPVDASQVAVSPFLPASQAANVALNTPPNNQTAVQGIFLLQFFIPSLGWTSIHPNFTVEIQGLNGLNITSGSTSISPGFPADDYVYINGQPNALYDGREWGGPYDFRYMITNRTLGTNTSSPPSATNFPFFTKIFNLPNNPATFTVNSLPLTVNIYAGQNTDKAHLVQTLNVTTSAGKFLVPKLAAPHSRLWGVNTAASKPANSSATASDASNLDRFCWLSNSNSWLFLASAPLSGSGGTNQNSIASNDTVQTMVPAVGDYRLVAGLHTVPSSYFVPNSQNPSWSSSIMNANGFITGIGVSLACEPTTATTSGLLVKNAAYSATVSPAVPASVNGTTIGSTGIAGDWDTGIATAPDGAYINKVDEGNNDGLPSSVPYYDTHGYDTVSATYFAANRQIPSPGMLGSLPTQVLNNPTGWQTLLFRPGPTGHPGLGTPSSGPPYTIPPDHLLMDLFWMPIVQPYAISEPFSSAGKVNMNCQIVPFTWITRDTALRAVLRGERVLALQGSQAGAYKTGAPAADYRSLLDLDQTLKGIEQRFTQTDANNNSGLYRSPTEICSTWLVPQGQSLSSISSYWASQNLSGDNVLERPYANIYGHLTTKSNTYTVHLWVQTLKKIANSNSAIWSDATDKVLAEYRGSTLLERYIDPNDSRLAKLDFATATLPTPAVTNSSTALTFNINQYYKTRILTTKRFNP